MTIWAITAALNVFLCLLLLYGGHYRKYRILFLSLIFELFAAPVLHHVYATYGVSSVAYYSAFHGKNFITILFCFGIIWEGFIWRNKCVRLPQELYLLALLIKFVAEKFQFILVSHLIYEVIRYIGIAVILFTAICFRKESPDERRYFKAPRA